jgi:hypothetical protein
MSCKSRYIVETETKESGTLIQSIFCLNASIHLAWSTDGLMGLCKSKIGKLSMQKKFTLGLHHCYTLE